MVPCSLSGQQLTVLYAGSLRKEKALITFHAALDLPTETGEPRCPPGGYLLTTLVNLRTGVHSKSRCLKCALPVRCRGPAAPSFPPDL